MSKRSSHISLDHFCSSVIENFRPEYLRKPTVTDVEKLYWHHEEKHEFREMLRNLDCTDWEWFGCPYGFKGQYVRRDHDPNSFILPEAGCYLIDEIYPELTTLVKTIPEPANDDHKRMLYKLKQESAKKDMERAFDILKKK
ncbi:RNA-directed DNA polymerase, eukaryota [Tanacetum coccineum]|uniref:RNA-directed DNA polymerase, eukaryota n=1 Tax=Tanacetum coccineum TaxID=301880 RepID=A0ABQ5HLF1_9ASTR